VRVTAAFVPPPSLSCCTYWWYHRDASGMWTNEGTKTLAAVTSPGSSANLVSLDLGNDLLEPAQATPSNCASASNVCWLVVGGFDDVNPGNS